MKPCFFSYWQGARAFTRIDLLAIVFTLAILALTLFPALARMHVAPQATQCILNLREITVGWWMYAENNQGKLAVSRGLFPANEDYNAYPRWVAGDMRGGIITAQPGATVYPGIDATNTQLLVDPHYSQMAAYIKNPVLYHCPTDQSTWSTSGTPGHNEQPRVRSYSMNGAIGPSENGTLIGQDVMGHWLSGGNASAPGGTPWRVPIKVSDLVAPAPSQLWLLLDEHPNSINDACFAFRMPLNQADTAWVDTPAPYHNNGCNFSFADGHVEYHKWLFPGLFASVVWEADSPTAPNLGGAQQNNPDILWVAHRTTALAASAPQSIYQP